MGTSIKIVELDSLNRKLRKNATLNDIKTVVSTNGNRLEDNELCQRWRMLRNIDRNHSSVNSNPLDGGMSYNWNSYSDPTQVNLQVHGARPVSKASNREVGAQFERDMRRLAE